MPAPIKIVDDDLADSLRSPRSTGSTPSPVGVTPMGAAASNTQPPSSVVAGSPTGTNPPGGPASTRTISFADRLTTTAGGGGGGSTTTKPTTASEGGGSKRGSVASSTAPPPPPAAAKNTCRFLNPLVEKQSREERIQRTTQRRRIDVGLERVPLLLSVAVKEDLKGMGLILRARYARLFGDSHTAAVASQAAGSLTHGSNHNAMEILSEVELHWAFGPWRHPLSQLHATSPSKQRLPALLTSILPVVVKPKVHLSNDDARVLFRSGSTRSGQYGIYVWEYKEESFDGVAPDTGPSTPTDPYNDYMLVDDAEEQREQDGGMMIPDDLRYLFASDDGGRPMTPGDDDVPVVSPAPREGESLYNAAGEHRYCGKRNLMTLSLVRLWQNQEAKAEIARAKMIGGSGNNTSSPLKKLKGGGAVRAASPATQRSRRVMLDSPRSAYILLKNGQLASELAVTADPLLEAKRQSRIAALQDEYRELRANVAQEDMISLLLGGDGQLPQRTSPTTPNDMSGLQQQRSGAMDGSMSESTMRPSSIPPTNERNTNSSTIVVGNQSLNTRPSDRPLSRTSIHNTDGGMNKTNQSIARSDRSTATDHHHHVRGAAVLSALEHHLDEVAKHQETDAQRRVRLHKQHLAQVWGAELQRFTLDHEKDRLVQERVANHLEQIRLRASGRLPRRSNVVSPGTGGGVRSATVPLVRRPYEDDDEPETGFRSGTSLDGAAHEELDEGRGSDGSPTTTTASFPRQTGGKSTHTTTTTTGDEGHIKASSNSIDPAYAHMTPMERTRAAYKRKEALRLEQLEATLAAKEAAAQKSQERKREQVEAVRQKQLTKMREVQSKAERNKSAKAFQSSLMVFRQDEHQQQLEDYQSSKAMVRKTIQDVRHIGDIQQHHNRDVFRGTQNELLKTMFYESQRRIAAEMLAQECTVPSKKGQNLRLTNGPAVSPTHRQRTPSRREEDELLDADEDDLDQIPVVDEVDDKPAVDMAELLKPGRRRTQYDPVVKLNSKPKLQSLLRVSGRLV